MHVTTSIVITSTQQLDVLYTDARQTVLHDGIETVLHSTSLTTLLGTNELTAFVATWLESTDPP